MKRYTYDEAKALLPLVESIDAEIQERWKEMKLLHAKQVAIATKDLEALGIEIRSHFPLEIYIPGCNMKKRKELIWVWHHGDTDLEYGLEANQHGVDFRRPLVFKDT